MSVAVEKMLHLMVSGREGAAKTPSQPFAHLPVAPRSYYRRIESYARRMRSARDLGEVAGLLGQALRETRTQEGENALRIAQDRMRRAQAEIEQLRDELRRAVSLTNSDPLTGAVNRRGLQEAYDREAARSDRHGNALCAALIDLDNFKAINDTRGHSAGDAALVHLAAVMRARLRPNDVIARVGGEEFLILLPDTGPQPAFLAIARLQAAMPGQPVEHAGFRFGIGFTASVAMRAYGESRENLSERLDQALYRAKRSGKNRVLFAVP